MVKFGNFHLIIQPHNTILNWKYYMYKMCFSLTGNLTVGIIIFLSKSNICEYTVKRWYQNAKNSTCWPYTYSCTAFQINTIFNNISVISWWSVLLVEETGVPGKNHQPAASHWPTLSHNVVSSTSRHERDLNPQH